VVREDVPGEKRLVGYVVGSGSRAPQLNEIRTALKAKLPDHMVPGLLVVREAMPLTADGKTDRWALSVAATQGYQEPRTAAEEVLAGIFAQVLSVERVGIDDNFFDLGGHSLMATLLMVRIREAFQVELPLRLLFEAPTVRGLGERIEAARRAGKGLEVPRIERVDRRERIPLSYAQQRLWFLDQLGPGSGLFNVYVGYRMKGVLDREALEWSIEEMVRRHESLRTRFVSDEAGVRQVTEGKEGFVVGDLNLTGMAEGERK